MRQVILGGCFTLLCATAAQAAAVAPTGNVWYETPAIVNAVTSACTDKVGSLGVGQLHLKSSGAAGSALLVYSAATTGNNAPDINVFTLPATPTASGGSTTGNFTEKALPTGKSKKGTMSITFTWGDANAFFAVIKTTIGSCVETYDLSPIQTGH